MAPTRVDVVHVGAASRDLDGDDPRGWRLGGGVSYGALTSARLGLRTGAVIGLDRQAVAADELELLRAAGVELHVVPLDEGPVFDNRETPTGRVQHAAAVGRPLPVPVPVSRLPAAWSRARAWSFVPVADEVADAWAEVPAHDALVSVGWQGLLRALRPGAIVARLDPGERALLRRADLVAVSRDDLGPDLALGDLLSLLGTHTRLLVSRGSEGGLFVEPLAGREPAPGREPADVPVLRYPPVRSDGEVDATGAGDTFLAALLAADLRPAVLGPLRRRRGGSLRFAAAAGSLVVEGLGLSGVPDLTAVQARATRDLEGPLVVRSSVPAALDPFADASMAATRSAS